MRKMPVNLYEIRDMGQVLSTTVQFIRENKKHLFKIVGLMVLPLVLMSSTFYSLNFTESLNATAIGNPYASFFSGNAILSLLTAYLSYVCMCWGIAYFLILYRDRGKDNFEISDVWNLVFKHGWKLLFVLLIYLIIFVILAIFTVFISAITVVLLPFFMFLILFLLVPFTLIPIVYLTDEEGFLHTIDRTFSLLKGNMLKGFGILLVSFIMIGVWAMIPAGIFGFLSLDIYRNLGRSTPNPALLIVVLNVIRVISLIAYFFVQLAFGIFYYSLSEQKDYISLKERISKIGARQISEPGLTEGGE